MCLGKAATQGAHYGQYLVPGNVFEQVNECRLAGDLFPARYYALMCDISISG